MKLKYLGYNNSFMRHADEFPAIGLEPARIIAVSKNSYLIHNGSKEIYAELSGKFLYQVDSALDLPTVGDWVMVNYFDDDNLAILHGLLPRQSLLKRKDPGKKLDYQLIAANIDTALIMQDLSSDFNLNRLERYLVMVTGSGIKPIILLNKSDLLSEHELDQKRTDLQRIGIEYDYFIFSSLTGSGFDQVAGIMIPYHTYCLLGSSGVGKTTLLNKLLGEQKFNTGEVRSTDGKGRHITTRRQLINLENGSLLIDTPGMRELAHIQTGSGIEQTFEDIGRLAEQCQFSDCTHVSERGCGILAALDDGRIDQQKYQNFIKILKESAFYQMSYLEKRKRDKAFGKMVKQVMKTKRKK